MTDYVLIMQKFYEWTVDVPSHNHLMNSGASHSILKPNLCYTESRQSFQVLWRPSLSWSTFVMSNSSFEATDTKTDRLVHLSSTTVTGDDWLVSVKCRDEVWHRPPLFSTPSHGCQKGQRSPVMAEDAIDGTRLQRGLHMHLSLEGRPPQEELIAMWQCRKEAGNWSFTAASAPLAHYSPVVQQTETYWCSIEHAAHEAKHFLLYKKMFLYESEIS